MLCVFLQSLVADLGTFTDIGCVIVAIAGILSCNPPGLLIGARWGPHFADHFLPAAYSAALRVFCIVQVEQHRSQKVRAPWVLLATGSAFFGLCALFDTAANLERAQFLSDSEVEVRTVLPGERAAIPLRVAVVVALLLWTAMAVWSSWASARTRVLVLGILTALNCAGIIVGKIVWVVRQTFAFRVLPEAVAMTTELAVGAFLVFFLRMEKEDGYAPLKGSEQGEIRFDVDEITSGDEEEEGFEATTYVNHCSS
jgi:hypothetical protein